MKTLAPFFSFPSLAMVADTSVNIGYIDTLILTSAAAVFYATMRAALAVCLCKGRGSVRPQEGRFVKDDESQTVQFLK